MTTERLPRYMTQQEVKRFFSAIKDRRDRALFGLIYLYGGAFGISYIASACYH